MPTNRLTQPKSLDDMLLYVLWQLQAAARRPVVRLCEAEFGITRREWRMLAQLADSEGMPSSALAERAALDRAQTSRAVSALVQKGLVVRTPRPGNRREVLLHLTERGRALYAALLPRVAAINQELLSVLSETEVATLDALVQRLRAQAERMVED
ncbi:MarR family transcriptional regulator [Ottowia beijingensis]|jgi:DNA-binding MarR family transcriptional regulator|uniref:MarR family transcriptional regulator n=1 Tax=Ottowia beijingensis TaxID=1207057 RepID=A0A853IYD5_9BURK|nr:MarR family transcriptional regulator [Ottowia beijingensis]MBP9953950.1 MarR family transcriptional regulator [Ottowia sp.]NZA02558.1 MarR family transcriptional regulator [Ottowia beijingensis]